MKYTVVIRQPVPEAILPQLSEQLSAQFELSADQATKLASRRSGRLMKPTSRKRAERLLQVFHDMGAQVSLEEVRDDTTLLSDPFANQRPGLVGPATLPVTPPTVTPPVVSGAGYAANDYLPAASLTADPGPYGSSPYGSGPLLPSDGSLNASGELSGSGLGSDWSRSDWSSGSGGSGGGVATVPPLSPAQTSSFQTLSAQAPSVQMPAAELSDALLPSDPLEVAPAFVQHDGQMITPQQLQSGVPEMNLGGLLDAGMKTGAAPLSQPLTPLSPFLNESGEPISDDAWADFTGSLTTANTGTATPETVGTTGLMTIDTSLDPVKQERRSSLSRRVLLSTLLPLALFTLVTLGFLVYALPRAQTRLITENAQAVAVAVGSNLDVTDQNTVYAQLDALIKRSSVGFVQVNLPDGTSFFRSKTAYTDGPLGEQIATWVRLHPDNSTFVQSGSPSDSYRYQLGLLDQVGAGDSEQAKSLKLSIADPANQKSTTTTYLLSSINVTQNTQGERVVGQGLTPASGTPLYSIVVGVPGDAAFAQLRNTLLLVLGVALLAFVLASLLAARTARRVVQPIERLVRAADAISMGDLDRPVTVERNDEIGDLAQALERMRLSLEAAMGRLRRRRKEG